METKQQFVKFSGSNGDEIITAMNLWLNNNKNCKIKNITNVDTYARWTIIALAECSNGCTSTSGVDNTSTFKSSL